MKKNLRVFSILMALLLLFSGSTGVNAYILTGDDTNLVSLTKNSNYVGVTNVGSVYSYKTFGTFNVSKKCVINTYVYDTREVGYMFAGKSNSFSGATQLKEANSNIHQDNYLLQYYCTEYFLALK